MTSRRGFEAKAKESYISYLLGHKGHILWPRPKFSLGSKGVHIPHIGSIPISRGGGREGIGGTHAFFYKEPVYKKPTCRRPKYLKNSYY